MSTKSTIYFRDIGSHPPRDLEVLLFDDGELEFRTDKSHINIDKKTVAELVLWLLEEKQGVKPAHMCEEEGCKEPAVMYFCETHAP